MLLLLRVLKVKRETMETRETEVPQASKGGVVPQDSLEVPVDLDLKVPLDSVEHQ